MMDINISLIIVSLVIILIIGFGGRVLLDRWLESAKTEDNLEKFYREEFPEHYINERKR